MSTSFASAALFAPDANDVLKPIITDPEAAAKSISLSVTNNGTTDLIINSVSYNFTPFSISQSFPLTIEPNQSTSLTIDLDTESKGVYEKKIKFDSNDQDPIRKLKEITLKADIFGVNEIYVGSSSGDKDSEITIPVTIKNQEEFTRFQFDMLLTSNIEYPEPPTI